MRSKVPLDRLEALYRELGTLDAVAQVVGLNKASIHERFQRHGVVCNNSFYTQEERSKILEAYQSDEPLDLNGLAAELGRPKANISRFARQMGLTDKRRKISAAGCANIAVGCKDKWQKRPHPRGFLGGAHSSVMRKKMGARVKDQWAHDKQHAVGFMSPEARRRRSLQALENFKRNKSLGGYSRCRGGYRSDLGLYVRSSWEANYARMLEALRKIGLIERWAYEEATFDLLDDTNVAGRTVYCPDFTVVINGCVEFHEVKGWMDARSARKLALMREQHPSAKLVLIDEAQYRHVRKLCKHDAHIWEGW